MLVTRCFFWVVLSLGVGTVQLVGQTAAAPGGLFQEKILPILHTNCIACHNEQIRTSGLAITSRDSLITGGNRGPAIVPGRAAESLLIRAIRQSGELKMPPGVQLPPDAVALLTEWVQSGAEWTAPLVSPLSGAPSSKGADHWAFQPVKRPPIPDVHRSGWVRNSIDNFVLMRLEKENIAPSPEADRHTLIRRLALDLTGIPPSPQEVEEFANDKRPDAYDRLVDRTLASPHYGERWGRHWLDNARYSDTNGYTRDGFRQIWMYRDWVIKALNRDLPFNQFVIEQIAGDLLPNPTPEQIVATGFHRNTYINLEGGVDFEQYRVEAVIDRVSTTGQVFLGLTLGCARCHDHKYDPVSQREFYQFYAFFNSIDELSGELSEEEGRARAFDPILEFGTPEQYVQRGAVSEQVAQLQKELDEYEKGLQEKYYRDWETIVSAEERAKLTDTGQAALRTEPGERTPAQQRILRRLVSRLDTGYQQRDAGIRAVQQLSPKIPHTMVMRELPQPRATQVLIGGDFTSKGIEVQPGTPGILPPLEKLGSYATRLDLARWLVDPRNPLTARVTVNRIWQGYFGRGLVETEEDFGLRGALPDHPELLDWLASEFVAGGWSLKAIHRLVVTSATYRQTSMHREDTRDVDPDNRLLSRQSRLRLEAEVVRDAALSASGLLQPQIGGPSVFPPQPEVAGPRPEGGPWVADKGENRYRRGLYTTHRRGSPHPVLMAFDQPDAAQSCTRRQRSNTPLQALAMLNDEAFFETAQALSKRILKESSLDRRERLRQAFILCLGRPPLSDEEAQLEQFLVRQLDRFQTHPEEAATISGARPGDNTPSLAAWTSLARILLNLDEFITRE